MSLDSLGLIPTAGGVARAIGHIGAYRGVVADQLGARVLQNVGFGAGLATTILGANGTSTTGMASSAVGAASIVAGIARATPVVGQVISGAQVGLDLIGTGMAVSKCN